MSDGLDITVDSRGFDHMMIELAGPSGELCAKRGLRAAGKIVQAAITDAAPERVDGLPSGTALPPGALKSDIELHVAKLSDGSIAAFIEPGKYTASVARWVEGGHKQFKGRKGRATGEVAPHPFIAPAFAAFRDAAEAKLIETVQAEMLKEAKRLGAE